MKARVDTGVVLSAASLLGAMMLLAAAVTRVTLATDAPPTALAAAPALEAPHPAPPAAFPDDNEDELTSAASLSLAVERAPFDPDRRPPTRRYLLPDQIAPAPLEAPPPDRPAPPQFRVLGTAAGPDGGVAVVLLQGNAVRVMTVGQEMGGYRVAAIEDGAVVMSGQGWDLTFAVADAQPIGPNRPQRDQNGRIVQQSRGQNDRPQQSRGESSNNTGAAERLRALEGVVQELRLGPAREGRLPWTTEGAVVITGPEGAVEARKVVVPTTAPEVISFKRPAPPGGG